MTVGRRTRLRRVVVLVPLAALSAAWTVSIATTGAPNATATDFRPTLPDGSRIPARALEIPASVTAPSGVPLGVTAESPTELVPDQGAASIPSTALAAYQRAPTVIDAADPTCHLPWQLLAAIGRVESDHGRAEGNHLSADGVAEPGIFGQPLDGTASTARILDSDAGGYDGDTDYDRAVGPMQFIPSTWAVVGVDGDGDGRRDPQDIDDAALAAAVYLCSGSEDLSTPAGRARAVQRYNHSTSYVATVLAVMRSYLAGDYTAAPNATVPATLFAPEPAPTRHATHGSSGRGHRMPSSTAPSSASGSPGTAGSSASATPSHGPSGPAAPKPTKPTKPVASATPTAVASAVTQPVVDVLSAAEALTLCSDQFAAVPDPLGLLRGAKQACADKVTGKTESAALALIPNTLSGILAWLGL